MSVHRTIGPLVLNGRLTHWFDYKYIFRVQESDGNFFENFTALSWRQENKRLRATNEVSAYGPLFAES